MTALSEASEALAPYPGLALDSAFRFLSRLDRRPWSPTYGCFDREYWNYKTLLEFPRPTLQQSVWSLTLLYRHPFPGNRLAGSERVRGWCLAAIEFWLRSRNADGSVDEWYRHERSFCATAFTTLAMTESLLLLRDELPAETLKDFLEKLVPTGDWLLANENPWIANQMIASLAALHNLGELTGLPRFREGYLRRKSAVLAMQSAEGWFTEYQGCDIGYSFLAIELMVGLWRRSADQEIKSALDRLLEFAAHFVHPDGTAGGEYGSRSTLHCFPFGLEHLASEGNLTARRLVPRVRRAIVERMCPTPQTIDDTYAAYFYSSSFTLSACEVQADSRTDSMTDSLGNPALSWSEPKLFPLAGLLAWETPTFYLVLGIGKGGVWRWFDKVSGEVSGDAGYVLVTTEGKRATSQSAGLYQVLKQTADCFEVSVETVFTKAEISLPLKRTVVLFKFFTNYLLKFPGLSLRFSRWLKQLKILSPQTSPARLARVFRASRKGLQIEDCVQLEAEMNVSELHRAMEGVTVHSPSAQLFNGLSLSGAFPDPVSEGVELNQTRKLERKISLQGHYFEKIQSRHA